MESYIIPDSKQIRIAISGQSGCGNTTVSSMLAERLGIRLINFTFRNLAREMNIPLKEILARAGEDDSFDKTIDQRQVEMAREGSCVLGSRLAVWMLPEADLKIYLRASPEVRAARIQKREGGDLNDVMAFTANRDAADAARYKKLYGLDVSSYGFADMIVNTDETPPQKIADSIIENMLERSLILPRES